MSSSNSAKIVTFSDEGSLSSLNSPLGIPSTSRHKPLDSEHSATLQNLQYTRARLRRRHQHHHHRHNHPPQGDSESSNGSEEEGESSPEFEESTPTTSDGDGDLSSCSETWEEAWSLVNEHKVTEITINFFYQPRTLTLLFLITLVLIFVAFIRDEEADPAANIAAGIYSLSFLFLSIGLLVFPNGPFTRPHPAFWRLIFGASVLYFLLFAFILFQRFSDVQNMLMWIDPILNGSSTDSTKLYAVDCSFTWDNVSSRLDVFILAHFFGWIFKALLVRHTGILWAISIMWECTELFFAHVLPNFAECWWDAIIFDVLICNGLGIFFGMWLCQWIEVKQFHWESIKDIKGARGKLKRAVLQFTPQEWSKTHWMSYSSPYMRTLAIFVLILLFQISELNTFLLKHILYVPTSHYLVSLRLALMCLIAAPSLRQYYVYVTDRTCMRLGTQAWVYFAIMVTELLFSVKFGMRILPRPAFLYVIGWLVLILLVSACAVLMLIRTSLKERIWGSGQGGKVHLTAAAPRDRTKHVDVVSVVDYSNGEMDESTVLQQSVRQRRSRKHRQHFRAKK